MSTSKTLYLHIGQHKTGTSTIQSFLWKNRERLEHNGVLYPELGMSGPTHANFALGLPGKRDEMVASMFESAASDRSETYRSYDGESADALFSQLGDRIGKTSCRAVFLSSECFMEWIEPASLKALIDRHCQCDVRILLFLRRQDQWIQSVFNQVVKDAGLRYGGPLEKLPQMEMLDYQRTVENWEGAFGRANIIVRPYQEAAHYEMGILGIVADVIGLQSIGDYAMPSFSERNVSLKRWQVGILHDLNRRDVSCRHFKRVLEAFSHQNEAADGSREPTNCIDFDQAKAIQKRYAHGNRWIARTFLGKRELFNKLDRREYVDSGSLDLSAASDFLSRMDDWDS